MSQITWLVLALALAGCATPLVAPKEYQMQLVPTLGPCSVKDEKDTVVKQTHCVIMSSDDFEGLMTELTELRKAIKGR